MRIQINIGHHTTLVFALSHQVPKVLERDITLLPHTESLVPTTAELLDRPLQSELQRVSGELENLSYGPRDARAVGVDVIHGLELLGDLGVEAMRERVGNLVQDVVCRSDS